MQQPMMYPPPGAGYEEPLTSSAVPMSMGKTAPSGDPELDGAVRFTSDGKYKDVAYAVLFVVHLLVVLVLCGVYAGDGMKAVKEEADEDLGDEGEAELGPGDAGKVAGILVVACIVAAVFSFSYLSVVQRNAHSMIVGTMIASAAVCFFFALYFFATGVAGMGVLMLLSAAINALFYYWWRPRIPFAAAVLETVSSILQRYSATIYLSLAFALVELAWFGFWAFAFVTTYFATTDSTARTEDEDEGASGMLYLFFVLSFYWTSQVIKNVLHVTIAGTVATYYFQSTDMPVNPTGASLHRAMTTSFGSICMGSLIVAAVKTVRAILRSVRDERSMTAVFIDCILACLEALIEKFNSYAYVYVAIYGLGFTDAAKQTWQLVKGRGIEAIVNDSLISNVLVLGALLGGALTAGITAAWAFAVIDDSGLRIVLVITAFLIGISITAVAMEAVQSGVNTIFVCFADDPNVLQVTQPGLHARFMDKVQL